MDSIVGYEKEKKDLANIREMLRNAKHYRENGVRIPRGLLLIGEPGVGKTVMARSIVAEGIELVELRSATCCDEDSIDAVKAVFEEAKSKSPCVLLLDEVDKIAGCSSRFYMEDNDRIRKTLLQELDSLGEKDEVLVVATCNDEMALSRELIRPGRFDRQMVIEAPDEYTRRRILESYFSKIKARKEIDFEALARNTRGFTGAKLECLANDSGIAALNKEDPVITEDDVRLVLNKLEFGTDEKDPFDDFPTLHRVATHEAGHAFAALYLCPDSIYGASVMPQGYCNGHVRFVSKENTVKTVKDIENEVAVLLAGHVAERIILGEYLTGSSDDISCAVTKLYLLSTKEAAYGYDAVPFGRSRAGGEDASELFKVNLEGIIKKKLTELDIMIEKLIYDHPRVYSAVCHALEEKKVLTRDELLKIKETASDEMAA